MIKGRGDKHLVKRQEARDELVFAIAYYRVAIASDDPEHYKQYRAVAKAHCQCCLQALEHHLPVSDIKKFAEFVFEHYTS